MPTQPFRAMDNFIRINMYRLDDTLNTGICIRGSKRSETLTIIILYLFIADSISAMHVHTITLILTFANAMFKDMSILKLSEIQNCHYDVQFIPWYLTDSIAKEVYQIFERTFYTSKKVICDGSSMH